MNNERGIYMVLCVERSGCVFVKEHDFFKSQQGFKEPWGRHWHPVIADSIEHARELGCAMFPNAKPYERQDAYGLRATTCTEARPAVSVKWLKNNPEE